MSVFCTPSTWSPEYFSRWPLMAKPRPLENEIPSSSGDAARKTPPLCGAGPRGSTSDGECRRRISRQKSTLWGCRSSPRARFACGNVQGALCPSNARLPSASHTARSALRRNGRKPSTRPEGALALDSARLYVQPPRHFTLSNPRAVRHRMWVTMFGRHLTRSYRCSDRLSVAIDAAALRELASASPTAAHNTVR